MTDTANEQALWFTRRIVALEAQVEELTTNLARADARRRDEADVADALAEQLRTAARAGLITHVTIPADDGPERDEAMRQNGMNLPLERWRRARKDRYPAAYRHVSIDPFEEEPWP